MATDYAALKKGGFMRQKQKDNFSLRLQVVGGNLTAENLETIAAVAKRFGDGYVHLTSRQGVEIPFIKLGDIDEVKSSLAEGGCKPGVCGPRVRTVTACQGIAICPSGCIETTELAIKVNERYYGRELPHKFKFGITGCQNNCLKAEENDLGIKGGFEVRWIRESCSFCGVCEKACREGAITISDNAVIIDASKCNYCGRCVKSCPTEAWKGESGFIISFGGLFGNRINQGVSFLPLVKDEARLFRVTDAAIAFFAKYGKPSERFKFAIDRVGWDAFEREIREAYHG